MEISFEILDSEDYISEVKGKIPVIRFEPEEGEVYFFRVVEEQVFIDKNVQGRNFRIIGTEYELYGIGVSDTHIYELNNVKTLKSKIKIFCPFGWHWKIKDTSEIVQLLLNLPPIR